VTPKKKKTKTVKAWAIYAPETGTILYVEKKKKNAQDFCRLENKLLGGFTWKAHPCTITYSL